MAVTCWLTANVSTWANAGSVIYYYDETEPVEEDRIKPYNSMPQPGDTFYMNGYNNTQQSDYTVNIPGGIIRNDLNPYTGRTGGQATGTGNNGVVNYICKEIHVGDTVFHSQGTNGSATINVTGDIYCEGTAAFFYKAGNGALYLRVTGNVYRGPDAQLTTAYSDRGGNIIINGNYYGYNVISTSGMNSSVIINGNVEMFGNRLCGQTHSSVIIYGNVKLHNNAYLSSAAQTSVVIYGNITLEGQELFTVKATTVNFYGDKITYSNFDPLKTLFFTNNLSVYSEQLEIERTDDYGESVLISKYQLDNTDQYPPENEVKEGTEYVWGEKVGTYTPDYPPESVVLNGFVYDNGNKTGNMSASAQVGCVTKEDVREGVSLIGMGEVGSLVVPSADDVREGVVFDNGSVGTLIVQGGGDRLRIADFGYYTNAQSDTYIVDLTEQDKPKFAVAEERVLIEMFPDIDLDNIPDKYFDDLFVKYLKYRLIVEYYRTAGINSTFTPSEPTTEIVNYQNVRNEVWLNSANIYLKAWGKKYPESITKPHRILL